MADESYRESEVDGTIVKWDPDQMRKIQEHPCYSEKASHTFGRAHLPVAPKCNVQCNYCVRKFDCVNESRPGVTSEILNPEQALKKIRDIVAEHPYIKVVGIAGPGDPLYNEATFETFRLIHENFPDLILCVSTNGLLLPDKIDLLEKYGVSNITVTMNALDPDVAAQIYQFINYQGKRYDSGREMGELLIGKQLEGIRLAVERKMLVKVNTVYIPGINDSQILEIAKKISSMGVYIHNIIPLIAQAKFAHLKPPTMEEKLAMQELCKPYVKQMSHCQRCRADAVGCLGKDINPCTGHKSE
ncbi:nitrogenase cofactor biosynthesis protein NifB [Methanospirillum lacunae]|uniref:FeMo cofactor biosynthesis protein NifB n=1 Tax=Methanospirillum lacunae TaxID=668570 RepID=A0A2V2NBH9_9EURY|nr:nitrogenase cofactor biosynthesis protein NifB [Methanospirillum lacunae]PWR73828.1 nitrogenase cofactor biosynthesis protein NifB [Methanospirillum lacunae]